MNMRLVPWILGLLSLLAVACGGGDDRALALSAIPQSVTLGVGDSSEVTLTLTRRGSDGTASLSASRLPTGMTATFEPAELTGERHTSVLTLQASALTALGSHVVEVQVTEGELTGTLELPIEVVTGSVSGRILFQAGMPMTTAIVEVLGRPGVLVDAEGRFEFREVTPPYDLRVSWPETGSVHIYRGLEARRLELKPFADHERPDVNKADYEVTITNWVRTASTDFLLWIYAEDQHVDLEWSTAPLETGRFVGAAEYVTPGAATLQALHLGRDANWVVYEYRGFLNAPMVLDQEGSAIGLNFEMEPIEAFEAIPEVTAAPGLSLLRVCPMVEQPHASGELFCNDAASGFPPLPKLPNGKLALMIEYANAEGGISRQVVRDVTPENSTPPVTFTAPPVLESPASGANIGLGQSFLVAAEGDAPITLTLRRPRSFQELHITTREREIAFPDPGPFVTYPSVSEWEWAVRTIPGARGWEVLDNGGVVSIQHQIDGFRRTAMGPQPHTTRSEFRPVQIGW
jgi:hypothetical protein